LELLTDTVFAAIRGYLQEILDSKPGGEALANTEGRRRISISTSLAHQK